MALVEYNHQWTDGEREIYDQSKVMLDSYFPRRLYGGLFVGFREIFSRAARDRIESTDLSVFSAINGVGVFCLASCFTFWMDCGVQGFLEFGGCFFISDKETTLHSTRHSKILAFVLKSTF
jgi:hypothetical protein